MRQSISLGLRVKNDGDVDMNQKIRKYVVVLILAALIFQNIDIVAAGANGDTMSPLVPTGGACYRPQSVTVSGQVHKGLIDCKIFTIFNPKDWSIGIFEGYAVEVQTIGNDNGKGNDDNHRKIRIWKDGDVVGSAVIKVGQDYTYFKKIDGIKVPIISVTLVSANVDMTRPATVGNRTTVRVIQVSESYT